MEGPEGSALQRPGVLCVRWAAGWPLPPEPGDLGSLLVHRGDGTGAAGLGLLTILVFPQSLL